MRVDYFTILLPEKEIVFFPQTTQYWITKFITFWLIEPQENPAPFLVSFLLELICLSGTNVPIICRPGWGENKMAAPMDFSY